MLIDEDTPTAITENNKGLHYDWGFIPMKESVVMAIGPSQTIDSTDMLQWVKAAHGKASKYNVPNYLGAKVAVVSLLEFPQWRHLLKNYRFSRVPYYAEFRFLLTLDFENFNFNMSVENHASARNFPRAFENYLETKVRQKAIVGPFNDAPFSKLHVSPMMARP